MRSWILTCFVLAIVASSCHRSSATPEELEKEKFADAILHKVATKMKHETNLRPCGTMGQMLHKVQKLGLSFNYYQPVDIAEARKLVIQAVNSMMEEMNSDTRIRPYLGKYPVTAWNVDMRIFLYNHDGRDVPPGNLSIIAASERFLRYTINHPETNRLVTIYKETYEEALERLKDPTLPLVPFEPDEMISQEDLARLRKGISLVTDDGSIWHLDEKGMWAKDPKE